MTAAAWGSGTATAIGTAWPGAATPTHVTPTAGAALIGTNTSALPDHQFTFTGVRTPDPKMIFFT